MRYINWNKINSISQSIFFILLIIYILLQILIYFKDIITLFLSAGLLAFITNELVIPLCKLKIPRGIAIVIVNIFILFIITGGLALLTPLIIQQANILINSIPDYIQKFQNLIQNSDKLNLMGIQIELGSTILSFIDSFKNFILSFSTNIPQILIDSFSIFINTIMVVIISIYLLIDFDKIWNKFLQLFSPNTKDNLNYFKDELVRSLRGFIIGQVFGALLTIIVLIIIYPLIKLNFGIITAVIYGLATLIPYFGPFIGIIPVAFISVFQGPVIFLIVMGVTIIFEQIKNSVILPKFMSESIGIHPLVIFIALLVGFKLGGMLGLILGIPIAGVLEAIIKVFVFKENKANQNSVA